MENSKLPNEVVEKILRVRDALVIGNNEEAYHQLYSIAAPLFDKYFPWEEMEKQVEYKKLNEAQIKEKFELSEAFTTLKIKYDAILATEDGHSSQTENVWQSGYAAGHDAATAKHKSEFERIQKSAIHYANRKDEVEKERDALRARNERMERALKAAKDALLVSEDNGDDFTSAFNKFTSAYKLIDEALSGEPEPQPTGNITLQETPSDMQDVDYPKLTPEQIQERKEAIEWIRNPAGGMRWVTGEYDRLYGQLKAQQERKIPCFVDYNFPGDTTQPCRDICAIRGKQMSFSARGISYGGAYALLKEENERVVFLKECERLHVEWLDEGKEVENA